MKKILRILLFVFGIYLFLLIMPISSLDKNIVGNYNNDQYRIFLNIFRFILINITKINLGIDITKDYISNLSIILSDISNKINNNNILNTLEYLNMNEKTLYVYNLDKKIFSLNIFSTLNNAK